MDEMMGATWGAAGAAGAAGASGSAAGATGKDDVVDADFTEVK